MSFTDILFAQSLSSGGGGASSLSELDDVNITSPSDGQAITYDETSGKWINDSISAGTDENVKQSPTTTDADYEILLSGSADNTEHTEGVKKTSTLRYNPDNESILVGDTTIPSGGSASHRYSSVTNNDVTVVNNYTTNLGANRSQTMQILPTDIVVQGDSEISGSWIGGENSLRNALVYAATHGGSSYTDVTGTLTAGSTSITLSNAAITTSSTLDYYTDTLGVNPLTSTVSTGSVVLTFEAQSSDIGVKVRVS